MKKMILKIAAVAVLAAATVLFAQIFAPSIRGTNNSTMQQPTIIDLGQAPDKSTADFANGTTPGNPLRNLDIIPDA